MKRSFNRSTLLPVSQGAAAGWFAEALARGRLCPIWEKPSNKKGKSWFSYCDLPLNKSTSHGYFENWNHSLEWTPVSAHECELRDSLSYRIRGGRLGDTLHVAEIEQRLDALFTYRHSLAAADCRLWGRYGWGHGKKIVVTGASGLIGAELCAFLESGGYEVVRLSRTPREGFVVWEPQNPGNALVVAALEGAAACVHLAGENIASGRWTAAKKQHIIDSRIQATQGLYKVISCLKKPPEVVICASGINAFGNGGDEFLDESSPFGTGYLAEVVQKWEAESSRFSDFGCRTVFLRFGMVLSSAGGALAPLVKTFLWGLGGPLGGGGQWMPWVALQDCLGAVLCAAVTPSVSGPVHVVAPGAVTNRAFSQTLGQVLERPCFVNTPASLAKVLLGDMAQELVLNSVRATPGKLRALDFPWAFPDLPGALRFYLGKR